MSRLDWWQRKSAGVARKKKKEKKVSRENEARTYIINGSAPMSVIDRANTEKLPRCPQHPNSTHPSRSTGIPNASGRKIPTLFEDQSVGVPKNRIRGYRSKHERLEPSKCLANVLAHDDDRWRKTNYGQKISANKFRRLYRFITRYCYDHI